MVVRAGLAWLREVCVQLTAAAVKDRVRGRLMDKLLALGPGYLIRTRTGEVQSTTVDGVEALENYFGRYLPQVLNCIVAAGVVVGYLFTQDVWVAVVTLLVVLFIPTVPRLVDRAVGRRGKEHWQAYRDLNAEFVDELQGMTTVKAFNATGRHRQKLLDRAVSLHRMTMRHMAVSLVDSGLTAFGQGAGAALAGRSGRRGGAGAGRRVRSRATRRAGHRHRGTRRHAVRRAAPAHRDRPGAAAQRADPGDGRGRVQPRHRERASPQRRHGRGPARPHHAAHRSPPVHHPQR